MLPSLILAAALAQAQVQAAADPYAACAGIVSADDRLACYDAASMRGRLAAPSAAEPGEGAVAGAATDQSGRLGVSGSPVAVADAPPLPATPPAPLRQPLPVPATPAAPVEDASRFGFTRQEAARTDSITAPIAELTLGRDKKARIVLTDGQVWRQVAGDSVSLRVPRGDQPQEATIRRAAMGSFKMRIEPLGKTIRVKRVQ